MSSPKIPRVLIIAGSDSGGGAGIQADIKACQALGAYSMTAIAALTAQNTRGVAAVEPVSPSFLRKQIEVCLEDIGADVIKTGMLASASVVEAAVSAVARKGIVKWVVDPVMVATSGDKLINSEAIDKIKKLLFPLADIITPNLPEAMALLNRTISGTAEDMLDAARELAQLGPKWVMIKGGHVEGSRIIPDVLYCSSSGESHVFPAWKLDSENTHGTGCTLASSIAAGLAQGMRMVEAVKRAKMFVWDAIRASSSLLIGGGHGPLHHSYKSVYIPQGQSIYRGRLVDYSLYAVTDDSCVAGQGMELSHAVSQAIEGGATIIQLRQKDVDSRKMLETAKKLMAICRAANVPFIVNDRVDIALACDADGVHVGQDDMPCDEVRRLLGPHKIVGVSVKTGEEAIKAQEDGADYIGSGAVYPTSTKDSSAIGLEGLSKVCKGCDIPCVAIGGLNASNCGEAIRLVRYGSSSS
ncbi:putative TH1,Thiamine [Guillardia theta CCMP2712]|uniref:thiamine phosphate synthase n=1 Tax=Guillardia theta (strain CCMP2712) TaxID=905079 RepID=L1K317_GUITC|nr:putative TH1,Thiamine [Guillardia theta CCMP2712]EKX55216.1 putative TH1,Thiamine [Guillardia theta CCMP2712]|eukprot:XP_005842196.1 putative TH1,Thiamine [Guillardia theta CCMP2712]